ncbi:spore germination B3 GerAC family protein [Alkaliphilus metalliredigens QYMF]|uniref:Spore germination B3 GerAC family protein n=1 Tax=Alkaliphilus metalliredigens (strain QYMF) TaxID=293826 RepID=A6TKM1_ALKMQ|nr:Ger(x)C family spore germination protein [Alkaliphilus metalliredigens]ABR46739.1 spore germination B3 GerAC family protein [Alkaliphilus metalliredigens QYMF]
MKKVIKLLIVLLLISSLSACWDARDLEELLIVFGLGIDMSEENPENYFFTIGFPTIIEEAPEQKSEFSTEAPSLGKGKSNLQQKVYRAISYDNVKIVVLGEEAARQGIIQHVDSMLREPLFRGTTRFAVVKDRAADLFELQPPVALFVSTFIFDSIQQNYENTTVPITTLRNFSNQYYTIGIEPAMPFICYGADRTELNVGCVALFRGDKMIHRLQGHDSKAFMLLIDEIHGGLYTFDYIPEGTEKGEFISITLKGGRSKIKTKLIDSQLYIYHDISINGNLGEYTASEHIMTEEKIEETENYLAGEVKKHLQSTVEILQYELQNDNVGYGKYVKANHPEFFNGENWNHQFSEAVIHVNPSVRIRTVGISP